MHEIGTKSFLTNFHYFHCSKAIVHLQRSARLSRSPLDKAIEEPSEIDVLTVLFEMNGYLVDTVLG